MELRLPSGLRNLPSTVPQKASDAQVTHHVSRRLWQCELRLKPFLTPKTSFGWLPNPSMASNRFVPPPWLAGTQRVAQVSFHLGTEGFKMHQREDFFHLFAAPESPVGTTGLFWKPEPDPDLRLQRAEEIAELHIL